MHTVHKLRHYILIFNLLYNNNYRKLYFAYTKCWLFSAKKLSIAIDCRLLLFNLYFRLHWATCWQLSTQKNAGRNLSKRTEKRFQTRLICSESISSVAIRTTTRSGKLCTSSEITCIKTLVKRSLPSIRRCWSIWTLQPRLLFAGELQPAAEVRYTAWCVSLTCWPLRVLLQLETKAGAEFLLYI